ncbi:MAG TPA: ROK family protein [Candidatus Krumholzibacteria bacterium]|nr:ROK family protein [Candidatus Krumholzibacteria bacterium]
MSTYLGIDIGGTNIKIAAVSAAGRVLARGILETRPHEGAAHAFRRIHDAARTLAGATGVHGVGIGCAGLIERERGVLRTSPNLPTWARAPLARLAGRHFSVPVVVDNDATCAAFGESVTRGPRGRHLVAITLGTGVGGGIVVDGHVVRGVSGYAGEVGHMTIDPSGPRCRCGARGCLEAYAGSYAIVAAARRASRRRRRITAPPRDARAVFDAARAGDAACRDAVREAGEALGTAVASLLDALNPSVVVIAGGIAGSFDLLEPHLRRAARAHAFPHAIRDAAIERSRLGNDAAVVGAAMLAKVGGPSRAPRKTRKRPV